MPRGPRGGMRNGTPGTAYTNRSDLARQPSLPARVATDQTYGKAQSQLQAQHQVPMAPAPVALPPGAPAGSPLAPQQPAGAPPPPMPIPPGAHGPLERPTERPTEPVTAGAPVGPGPGPEVLPQGPANPTANTNLSTLLAQVANQTGSSALQALAQHAAAAGT